MKDEQSSASIPEEPSPQEALKPFLIGTTLLATMSLAVIGVGILSMIAVRSLRTQIQSAQGEVSAVEERIVGLQATALRAEELFEEVRVLKAEGDVLRAEGDALRTAKEGLEREGERLSRSLGRSRRQVGDLQGDLQRVLEEKAAVEEQLVERDARISVLQESVEVLSLQRRELTQRVDHADKKLQRVVREREDLSVELAFDRAVTEAWRQACSDTARSGHRRCIEEVGATMQQLRSAYMACAGGGDRPWVKTLERSASAPEAWQAIRDRTYLALCNPDLPLDGSS